MIKHILPFLMFLLFVSCKKDTLTPTTSTINHQYSFGKNSLIGYTGAYDYMYPDSNVNDGIMVRVIGGNKVIDSTITDNTGRFQIDSLEVGTYDISITKEGWATYRTKSVFCGPGPSPTIVYFENDNPYGYRFNPLVRSVYSDIISVQMDSVRGSRAYFCMTIDPSQLDLVDSLQICLVDRFNSFESSLRNCYGPRVISPNKLVFSIDYYSSWSGVKKFDFVLFSYLDYVVCGSILNNRGNFELTNAHKIMKDVTIIFP